MPLSPASDRLPSGDALFLYLEKKEMPLHIASVSVFDGPIPMNRLKPFIESKLPLIPRYRQRIVFSPLNVGHPTWEYDPEFDIRKHIKQAHLKHGTDEELRALCGKVLSEMMDRNRPLWDVTIVDGLEGGRSALISRVHHCLVDGVAGVGLMNVLLDKTAKMPRFPKKAPFSPPPLPDTGTRLVNALIGSYAEFTDRLFSAQSSALNIAEAMAGEFALNSFSQFARLMPDLFAPVERLPFNQPVLGPRNVSWAEFSIPEVKAIREAIGGKLNDVMLTVVAGAVQRYAELHGVQLKGRLLKVMVPVNIRGASQGPGVVGNQVSLIPVSIPLDIADPAELLGTIHRSTEALKHAHVADLISLATTWMGTAPAPLQAAFGLLGNVLPLPLWNMVCTNVPGPQFPLYALGREMLTYYPYVPIGNDMGLCCAIESYNGKLYLTFTGDAKSVPDLDRVRDFCVETFSRLREKAGLAPAPVERVRPQPRPVAPRRPRQKRIIVANSAANGAAIGSVNGNGNGSHAVEIPMETPAEEQPMRQAKAAAAATTQ